MNSKNNNISSVTEDSSTSESKKMREITEVLNILVAEKETREKGDKIKRIVWILMLVMIIYNTFIFFSMYRYFTSQEFLESMKYRAIEAMPRISQELGKTAEQSAPILFEQLKGQFESYLPVMKDKILEQYTQLTKQAADVSQQQFNSMVNAQLDEVLNKMKLVNGMSMSQEQFDQLKSTMVEKVNSSVNELIAKNVGEQLNRCVDGAYALKQFGNDFNKATADLSGKLDTKSEIERKKIGFDIMRSFLDAIDGKVTGRMPEALK